MPDHLFVVIFAVIYPISGFIGFRRLLKKLAAGMPVNRRQLYLSTFSWHWILFVLALIVWAFGDRPWQELGFSLDFNSRFFIAAALTVAGIGMLLAQLGLLQNGSQIDLHKLEDSLGDVALFMPCNASELLRFNILSVTAGIVEETLWRGYLIWYLIQFVPLWAATAVSAIGFGVAHAYQGLRQIPKVIVAGALFSGLYVLSGSLWLSIVLHAAMDLAQGRLVYNVYRGPDSVKSS